MNCKLMIAVTLTMITTSACTPAQDQTGLPAIALDLPKLNTKAGNFSSCTEIATWRDKKNSIWKYYMSLLSQYRGPIPVASASASNTHQPTNIQESGIDEPDMLKMDAQSLFVARTQSVEIISKATLQAEQTLDFSDLRDLQLFTDGVKLAVLGSVMAATSVTPPYAMPPETYAVRIFARNGSGAFALESEQTLSGHFVNARLANGKMTLVLQEYLSWDDITTDSAGKIHGVNCAAIQKPLMDDFNSSLTYVHTISFAKPSQIQSFARFGRADQIYMGQNSLYVVATGFDWFWWDPRVAYGSNYNTLIISKFDVADCPRFVAAGAVLGWSRDQFSFKEDASTGLLYVATSMAIDSTKSNKLWVLGALGSDLAIQGASQSFGETEDIRSVRFVDDKAYIVTFQKTDPLFVFDLSDPYRPHLLSKLTVPGFSAYLHPLAGGKILGVGYGAVAEDGFSWLAGVQLSVFDVANPAQVNLLDQKEYGARFSHADVSDDHHAFYLDDDSGLLALPVRLLLPPLSSDPSAISDQLDFSGALLVNLKSPMTTVAKLTHWDWIPENCQKMQTYGGWWLGAQPTLDIRRVMKLNGSIVTVSPFGIRASDPTNNYAMIHELKFADAEGECTRQQHPVLY